MMMRALDQLIMYKGSSLSSLHNKMLFPYCLSSYWIKFKISQTSLFCFKTLLSFSFDPLVDEGFFIKCLKGLI